MMLDSEEEDINMAGMIRSIFGLTTEEVRQQQRQEQEKRRQAMSQRLQQQGTSPFAAEFGTTFGQQLGRGLLSAVGYESPEMAQAKQAEAKQEELNQKLSGLAPEDPARFYILAEFMLEAGDAKSAATYISQGSALERAQRAENRAVESLGIQKQELEYKIQKDLNEREREKLEAGKAKNLKTMYDPSGNPINVFEMNDQQVAMINGSPVLIQNLPQPLLNNDPTDGGTIEPFIPKAPTAAQRGQIQDVLSAMEIDLPADMLNLYTSRLASELQIKKDMFEKQAKKTKDPDAKWKGDEQAIRSFIERDKSANILKFEEGLFGFGGDYSLQQ